VLLAIMDIRAHPISFSERPREAGWVTRSRVRRRDRFSISLIGFGMERDVEPATAVRPLRWRGLRGLRSTELDIDQWSPDKRLGPFFGHVETLHPLTHGACCPAIILPVRHADDVCSGVIRLVPLFSTIGSAKTSIWSPCASTTASAVSEARSSQNTDLVYHFSSKPKPRHCPGLFYS
jgi:hypothetical protein